MEKTPLAEKFGAVIRRLREERRMSQEEFSHLVGIHRTYQGAIERGEKTVTIETAQKLSKALNLSLSELFALLEKPES